MTTKYKHCYSNYVNHILNTSPTKVAYSFAKGERFSSPKKQKDAPLDKILQKNVHPDVAKKYHVDIPLQVNLSPQNMLNNNYIEPLKDKKSNQKFKQSPNLKSQRKRSKSKNQKQQNLLIDKYLASQPRRVTQFQNPLFERSPNKYSNQKGSRLHGEALRYTDLNRSNPGKRKVWQKGEDRFRKQRFPQNCLYVNPSFHYQPPQLPVHYPLQDLVYETNYLKDPYNQFLKYSPYYPAYVAQNQERLQQLLAKSRQKSAKKLNRSLSQKPKSKHYKMKTTTDVLQQLDHPSKNITSRGYYPVGIEIKPDGKYPVSTIKNVPSHSFGPPSHSKSNKKLSPGKNDKLNRSKEINFSREKSYSNIPKTYETYQPFSQFGTVHPFKI